MVFIVPTNKGYTPDCCTLEIKPAHSLEHTWEDWYSNLETFQSFTAIFVSGNSIHPQKPKK